MTQVSKPAIGTFKIEARDSDTQARAATFTTAHGDVKMPAFFPVATRGAIKMATLTEAREFGAQGLLMNAFHLHLRPGAEMIQKYGGLHKFTGWDKAIVTDSGGFQIFSLEKLRKISDEGVVFNSPIDGSRHEFTPENVLELQIKLGSDVMIALDECVAYPAPREAVEDGMRRTIRWLDRAVTHWKKLPPTDQMLFGVVQGGCIKELRLECASALAEKDLPGYAIGGVSVGEGSELMREVLSYTVSALPDEKPRYVMGVGTPQDLLDAVAEGVDMFDCVMPTRNARGASAFTRDGKLRLRNAQYAGSEEPIEADCDCSCCRSVSRGYLRHQFMVKESVAGMLVTQHNLRFYARLMEDVREAILHNRFGAFRREFLDRYNTGDNITQKET